MDHHQEPSSNAAPPQTFMASHVEVSNGFVKNGTSLPYVIETNKSGNKKRSSKILPVCGICGKKFVCVTTMKRHLVTHTGERPFNCKVCGKQYTQKGNLRVHERTHRNDRPFECNICHQKFYRKEPMQKHQWRQHGIGHYKSRPSGADGPTLGIIGAEGVLYNSLMERAKPDPEDTDHKFAPVYEVPEAAAHTEVDTFSEDEDVESTKSISRVVTRYINDNTSQPEQRKPLEVLSISLLDSAPESLVSHQIDNNNHQPGEQQQPADTEDVAARPPLKLKMKLAQAYLREVKENREREEKDSRDNEGRDSFGAVTVLAGLEENLSDIKLTKNPQVQAEASRPVPAEHSEYVECICKSCGSKCLVSDPYNFSCGQCQVKYTSLPTHMIADPLQCIGCLKTFDHKPAMKEHQSSNDKERPFVCCKCGYEFKQKAHLQKHQWRIHRRKLEPDPNVKEAEAILKAVNEMSTSSPSTPKESDNKMTIQQIIDRGIEEEMSRSEPLEAGAPLDLSPCKMYGSANSITQWVQQVETARTPIVPDISILPREPLPQVLLSQLRPQSESVSVTIQLLEPQTTKHYAVKSKPALANLEPVQSTWRNSSRDNNPLLNQKSLPEEMSSPGTILYLDRGHKRVRTELTDSPQTTPADLSINQKLDFSPPLNLSSKHQVQQDDLPFDYRISRSDLITGQLARMRSQDERSGI